MKNVLLIFLTFIPASVMAVMLPLTTICTDNGWAEIHIQYKPKKKSHYQSGFEVCVLPDGKFYNPWQLERHKNEQYKDLFDQYSGQYPTAEQIEKVKEEFRQNPSGYIVN